MISHAEYVHIIQGGECSRFLPFENDRFVNTNVKVTAFASAAANLTLTFLLYFY